jgi:hypothetical protein
MVRTNLGDPEIEEAEEEGEALEVSPLFSSLMISVDVAENVRQDSQASTRACGMVRFL